MGELGRSRRGRRIAVILALALMLGASADGAAAAATPVLKAMWGPGVRDGRSLFPTFRDLKVKLYEDVLRWNLVARRRPKNPRNPNDPAYVWPAEVTSSVGQAGRYGMSVALQIIGSPSWANGGKPARWAPHRPRDYADFAIAAARRYRVGSPVDDLGRAVALAQFPPARRRRGRTCRSTRTSASRRICMRGCSTPPTGRSRASARPTW